MVHVVFKLTVFFSCCGTLNLRFVDQFPQFNAIFSFQTLPQIVTVTLTIVGRGLDKS